MTPASFDSHSPYGCALEPDATVYIRYRVLECADMLRVLAAMLVVHANRLE